MEIVLTVLVIWLGVAILVAIPLGKLLKRNRLERERQGERPLDRDS